MPIKVQCSGCGVTLTTPDAYAGKRAKCPKCGQAIQIPQVEEVVVEEEVVDAEESLFDGLSDDDLTSGEVSQDDRKPCPACGEMIVRSAVKCRYCGEIFDETLKKQEQKKVKKQAASGDGDLSVFEWIVAILCSGIGCIMGIIWLIQGNPKGKKMLTVSLCVQGFWFLVNVIIGVLSNMNNM